MTRQAFYDRCLQIANLEIGTREIPGRGKDNPRILEYHATTTYHAKQDEVPWCSSFLNWVVTKAGVKGTNSAAARSWLYWGELCTDPVPGCIVVLKRGAPPSAHVGFFIRRVEGGFIKVLGGNQSDQVKLSYFPEADVLGYRTIKEEA